MSLSLRIASYLEKQNIRSFTIFLIITLMLFPVGFMINYIKTPINEEMDLLFVFLLFLLPFTVFVPLLKQSEEKLLQGLFSICMLLAIVSYLLFWLLYHTLKQFWLMQYLPIIPVILLVSEAIAFTWIILESPTGKDDPRSKIYEQLKMHPFWSLCLLFSMFISVTYLIGFAFAYNDAYLKGENNRGLYVNPITVPEQMKKQPSVVLSSAVNPDRDKDVAQLIYLFGQEDEDYDKQKDQVIEMFKGIWTNDKMENGPKNDSTKINGLINHTSNYENLITNIINNLKNIPIKNVFKERMARLIILSATERKLNYQRFRSIKPEVLWILSNSHERKGKTVSKEEANTIAMGISNLSLIRHTFMRTVYFKSGETNADNEIKYNDELKKITDEIRSHSDKYNRRILVSLIGHADPNQIKDTKFNSNYELSEARAKVVQADLMVALLSDIGTWPNIEWQIVPMSSIKPGNEKIDDNAMRMVEIWLSVLPEHMTQHQINAIHEARELTILEYMYFSIYTITTTGYGDILPVSSYAKFLVSISNFLELFFLVIFFNVFVSATEKNSSKKK